MNLSIFQELLTPFLTVSLFSRKSTYLFTDVFKDNLDIVEDKRKKSQVSPHTPGNHYFDVVHIDHHAMHYSITKKHTLSLHVKNIDIKKCD